jgi:hypothetical protein
MRSALERRLKPREPNGNRRTGSSCKTATDQLERGTGGPWRGDARHDCAITTPASRSLSEFVFPQLRKRCELRGVTWTEVDLRWGMTDEEKAEGRVLSLCLAEIQRCQLFLGFLGERYGWVPETIPDEVFQRERFLCMSSLRRGCENLLFSVSRRALGPAICGRPRRQTLSLAQQESRQDRA